MVRGKLKKSLLHIATILSLSATLFVTDVSAKSGATGTEYNSKGTVTDEYDINIDSTDIYTLDDAIDANNKTLENYSATAGDIYNNLSAIDSAVAKAKTNIAQSLEDMNIYVSRTDAGAVNSHAGTTDWVGTTTAAKSAAVANYTLEELIGQMKTSVTGANSEMTAKINAGDFRSKKATSSVSSGSQPIKLAGATEINLDKNQQLVLPGGYYGNGMTINNVISGETLNWNPTGKATLVIDKPYTNGTISTSNAYDAGYAAGKAAGITEGRGQNTGFGRGSYTLDTLAWVGRACDCFSNSYMVSPPMGYDGTVSLDYIASGGWRDNQTGGVTGTLTVHNMTRGTSVSYSGSEQGRMNITGRTLSFYKNDVIKITLDANSPSWHAWCQGGVTFY
ncbi:hypothetical protein [Butyrivibrio sp. AE2005]|uniref:hypothetical protein n=1 Tax=Butyrivibrio sp. AE2005 TaxID=1496722 RepID=UPI00047E80F5|nr:hypothetical protein [Butyrivibrio sp. AE2005]